MEHCFNMCVSTVLFLEQTNFFLKFPVSTLFIDLYETILLTTYRKYVTNTVKLTIT